MKDRYLILLLTLMIGSVTTNIKALTAESCSPTTSNVMEEKNHRRDQISVSFDIQNKSKASIKLCDEWGSVLSMTDKTVVVDAGHHSFHLPKPKNTSFVFVVLTIDGHINVKKYYLK